MPTANAVDDDAPRVGPHDAGKHAQGGGFAGTIRSDQAENFARLHGEAQAAHRRQRTETLFQPVDFNHCRSGRSHHDPVACNSTLASAGIPVTSS